MTELDSLIRELDENHVYVAMDRSTEQVIFLAGPGAEPLKALFVALDRNEKHFLHGQETMRKFGADPYSRKVSLPVALSSMEGGDVMVFPHDIAVPFTKKGVLDCYGDDPSWDALSASGVRKRAVIEVLGYVRSLREMRAEQDHEGAQQVQELLDQGISVRLSAVPARTTPFVVTVAIPGGGQGLEHVAPLLVQDQEEEITWLYVEPETSAILLGKLSDCGHGQFWARELPDASAIIIDTETEVVPVF
jgi:hypothetical protein